MNRLEKTLWFIEVVFCLVLMQSDQINCLYFFLYPTAFSYGNLINSDKFNWILSNSTKFICSYLAYRNKHQNINMSTRQNITLYFLWNNLKTIYGVINMNLEDITNTIQTTAVYVFDNDNSVSDFVEAFQDLRENSI